MSLPEQPKSELDKLKELSVGLSMNELLELLQAQTMDLAGLIVERKRIKARESLVRKKIAWLRTRTYLMSRGTKLMQFENFVRYKLRAIIRSQRYPAEPETDAWVMADRAGNVAKSYSFWLKGNADQIDAMRRRFGDKILIHHMWEISTSSLPVLVVALKMGLKYLRSTARFHGRRRYTEDTRRDVSNLYMIRRTDGPYTGLPNKLDFKAPRKVVWEYTRPKTGRQAEVHTDNESVQVHEGGGTPVGT